MTKTFRENFQWAIQEICDNWPRQLSSAFFNPSVNCENLAQRSNPNPITHLRWCFQQALWLYTCSCQTQHNFQDDLYIWFCSWKLSLPMVIYSQSYKVCPFNPRFYSLSYLRLSESNFGSTQQTQNNLRFRLSWMKGVLQLFLLSCRSQDLVLEDFNLKELRCALI